MGRGTKVAALCALVGMACSGREGPPAEVDAGADAGEAVDAGFDAGTDAGGEEDAGTDAGPIDAGPLTGDTYFYVLDVIDLGAEGPDGIAPGFDLDGTTDEICRREDWTSPAPESMPGIDNSLGPILADGEEQFRVREALALNVSSGRLILLARLRGVDSFEDDPRVELDVLFGVLPDGVFAPMLTGSRYVPGQTFDLDARALDEDGMTALSQLPASIVDGRLQAGPGTLPLTVPFGTELVTLELGQVRLAVDVSEEGLSNGVVGGALDVEDTIAVLSDVDGLDAELVRTALETFADLDPQVGRNDCRSISVALVFDATTAVAGAVVTPE
jgi:hypothetical protein